jgi:hypothetical protein
MMVYMRMCGADLRSGFGCCATHKNPGLSHSIHEDPPDLSKIQCTRAYRKGWHEINWATPRVLTDPDFVAQVSLPSHARFH